MATVGGAEALGLEELGTLEAGKRAALVYAEADCVVEAPFEALMAEELSLQPVNLSC